MHCVIGYIYGDDPGSAASSETGGVIVSDTGNSTLVRLGDTDQTVADPSEDIRGRDVIDRDGEDIGKVDALMIDEEEGKVRFLQVKGGGFLGIGDQTVMIPVDAITRIENDRVHVDQTQEHIAGGPTYDPALAEQPAYWENASSHYGYGPYWGAGYAYPAYPFYGAGVMGMPRDAEPRGVTDPPSSAPEQWSVERTAATPRSEATRPAHTVESGAGGIGQGSIEQVQEGMRVIDSAGEEIGTVELVRMGDPGAVTVEGEDEGSGGEGLLGGVADGIGFEDEPDLPGTLRRRLLRFGFIKVDGKGLFSKDRYVKADKIAGVSGDTVRLNVRKDQTAEEA